MTTIAGVDLDITPLSRTIGAAIRGVDLRAPLDEGTVAAIRHTLNERRVIFFPGACLTPAEHVAFARYFGEVTDAHPVVRGLEEHPEVFQIDYAGTDNGIGWHTDVTFIEAPPMGSILNAITMPPSGGDTMWSDQIAAFNGLSPAMQDFLSRLTAVHDGSRSFGKVRKDGSELAPSEHPVIRTHPENGQRSIFVNPGFTRYIKELSRAESEAVLSFLYSHSVRPEYVVRYHWESGDLGFWDNRATMHFVVGDYGGQDRLIQRVTLQGDRPV